VENQQGFFSRKLRAGKRRTYFFDVRSTKQGDFFVTITESKRRFDRPGYDSHKIFLYKEDFTKFGEALAETITHIKTELNPDFDYDAYDRETYQASIDENGYENEPDERSERKEKAERKDKSEKTHKPERSQKPNRSSENAKGDFKKPPRPNKDLTTMPYANKSVSKPLIENKDDVTPPSDEAMEW
jgi:hypothetical protein